MIEYRFRLQESVVGTEMVENTVTLVIDTAQFVCKFRRDFERSRLVKLHLSTFDAMLDMT